MWKQCFTKVQKSYIPCRAKVCKELHVSCSMVCYFMCKCLESHCKVPWAKQQALTIPVFVKREVVNKLLLYNLVSTWNLTTVAFIAMTTQTTYKNATLHFSIHERLTILSHNSGLGINARSSWLCITPYNVWAQAPMSDRVKHGTKHKWASWLVCIIICMNFL